MMRKAVLLCLQPGAPFELSPPRFQLAKELYERGYETYVFFPGRVIDKEIRNKVSHWVNTIGMVNRDIRGKIREIKPSFLIAFTYDDAIVAYCLSQIMKDVKFIYFNVEIYTAYYEFSVNQKNIKGYFTALTQYTFNKIREMIYTRNSELLVVQDSLRKKILSEHHIKHNRTILIPNSHIFQKESIWNGIPSGICYSGSFDNIWIEPLVDGFEVVKSPITFAGWGNLSISKKIKKMPNIQAIFQKLSSKDLDVFLSKYAVGLVSYSESMDDNVKYIGLASGKFFKHLSLGQPVIAIYSPGMAEEIEKHNLGIVIHKASEIDAAYKIIMGNYGYYRKNVIDTYIKKYDYKKNIQIFINYVERIIG